VAEAEQARSAAQDAFIELSRRIEIQKKSNADQMKFWEAERDGEFMHGFTQNYVKVKTLFNPTLVNQTALVELQAINVDGVVSVAKRAVP
jgi:threonylcarbamoyladenosine tRNA methylthiotransferase MtaB